MDLNRHDGRLSHEVRPIKLTFDLLGYADASIFFEIGNTKIQTSVTLQPGVPHFLKGQRVGWLSAEYAMLPSATHQRTNRESNQAQRNARSVEISRLIGRCLRPSIDLSALGERTIVIDCDVLQADGGTRVAAITAASLALELAAQRWFDRKIVARNIFHTKIAALSAGIVNGKPYVDLSYQEDSIAEADFNFVVSKDGNLIEIQGTAEKNPINWKDFDTLRSMTLEGITQIFEQCEKLVSTNLPIQITNQSQPKQKTHSQEHIRTTEKQEPKKAFFSLANRMPNTP